jgi:hypothetical protein
MAKMGSLSASKVIVAIIASLLFMAAVHLAVQMYYPSGTENVSKGKISVITTPARQAANR